MSSITIPKEQNALVLNELHKPELITIPVYEPGDDQVLIQNKAIALNPTDWKHITGKIGHPNSIVGSDAAGIVVKVGKNVKSLKVGDNVCSFVRGSFYPLPKPGAFCEYMIGYERATFKIDYEIGLSDATEIPVGSVLSYEAASTVALCLCTIGYSFYYSLGLDKSNNYSNDSILIWSGSTAAGSTAIQVAKWLGFKNVITTASPSNYASLKQFGATHTYNYKAEDVVSQIRADFGDDVTYALDCFASRDSFTKTYEVLSNTKESHIDNLLFLGERDLETSNLKSTKVSFGATLAYPVSGEDAPFGNVLIPATPDMLKKFEKFRADFQGQLDSRKLLHIPIQIWPKGLVGIIDALTVMKEGSYSHKKFVLRLNETPE